MSSPQGQLRKPSRTLRPGDGGALGLWERPRPHQHHLHLRRPCGGHRGRVPGPRGHPPPPSNRLPHPGGGGAACPQGGSRSPHLRRPGHPRGQLRPHQKRPQVPSPGELRRGHLLPPPGLGPGFVAKAAQEDPEVARYLAGKENLFTATADLNAKVVRLWRVRCKTASRPR